MQTKLSLMFTCVLFCFLFALVYPACQPPDVPLGGFYTPQREKYQPGDTVIYSCRDGFLRIGRDSRRTCQAIGKWTGSTPFCDSPSKIKNPRSADFSKTASNVVDGFPKTCFTSKKATGGSLQVYLENAAVVNAVRLYLQNGTTKIQVETVRGSKRDICANYDRDIEADQWVLLKCGDSNEPAQSVLIKDQSPQANILTICEVEVYVKDTVWCDTPPDIFIPKGYLEVDRDKATLHCAEGFKEGDNTRIVCDEYNKWVGPNLQCEEILCDVAIGNGALSKGEWLIQGNDNKLATGTKRNLRCENGYDKVGYPDTVICLKNGSWSKSTATCVEKKEENKSSLKIIAISVGVVVVVLIFIFLGLTLYCVQKRRSKEVVVVFKQDDLGKPSCGSPGTTYSDSDYSTVTYDTIHEDPQSREPYRPPLILPNLKGGYANPIDGRRQPAKMITAKNQLPADIAFGTLKSSALYSS